jgi:DNA-binding HxlR family transcriptional regulator
VNNPSVPGAKVGSTIYLGKWSVSILSSLRDKPHRHGELRRRLGDVSQRILTRTLRNLELAGLITRSVNNSKPIAAEYSLTPVGRTFMGPLTHICRWANRYDKELRATVRLLNIDRTH